MAEPDVPQYEVRNGIADQVLEVEVLGYLQEHHAAVADPEQGQRHGRLHAAPVLVNEHPREQGRQHEQGDGRREERAHVSSLSSSSRVRPVNHASPVPAPLSPDCRVDTTLAGTPSAME